MANSTLNPAKLLSRPTGKKPRLTGPTNGHSRNLETAKSKNSLSLRSNPLEWVDLDDSPAD